MDFRYYVRPPILVEYSPTLRFWNPIEMHIIEHIHDDIAELIR
jgi:hypothetical protein